MGQKVVARFSDYSSPVMNYLYQINPVLSLFHGYE